MAGVLSGGIVETVEIRHFQGFCGSGGGKKGFNCGHARVGSLQAKFRCIGGIDSDPAAIADFNKWAGARGTVMDLFDREQYIAWHGKQPPEDWREMTAADIRRAAGNERPHIIFLSPPCKGFSGLLAEKRSQGEKYQALNRLTLRGIWLMLEAWADDPPEFFILENVPRIMNRGRYLLDQIIDLLRRYGYAVAETTHDCGELGGLAQSRRRFLLVARHTEKVPPFLYEPTKRPLRAVGEILDRMPLPGDMTAGPMHRLPALHWKTWVRLAFVKAGSDWRSLNRLAVEDGYLRDYLLVPEMHNGALGVREWSQHGCTVTGTCRSFNGAHNVADPRTDAFAQAWGVLNYSETAGAIAGQTLPSNGRFSVADPRYNGESFGQYGVRKYDQHAAAITSQRSPGQGPFSVADPRPAWNRHSNAYRVVKTGETSPVVIGGGKGVQGGQLSVADPRMPPNDSRHLNLYRVIDYGQHSKTIIGATRPGSGAMTVADPRPSLNRKKGDNYLTGGHYGVVPYTNPTNAIAGSACHDNGYNSVADPRLPAPDEKCTPLIIAEDNTWHRPFTTLELAALQGLIDPGEHLELYGSSDSAWRERIGNAVPPPAAEAIANVMAKTLLLAWTGETFVLSDTPVWVRPIAVSLSVDQRRVE